MDLCCSTKFTVSRAGDKSGDLAIITKKNKDPGCIGLCVALCTPADTYNLDFSPGHKLSATQKAAIIGEMIHLDFLFFEAESYFRRNDNDPVSLIGADCRCEKEKPVAIEKNKSAAEKSAKSEMLEEACQLQG